MPHWSGCSYLRAWEELYNENKLSKYKLLNVFNTSGFQLEGYSIVPTMNIPCSTFIK